MKKELTFDNYIAMCDRFDKAEVKCGDWWPTVTEIQTKIEPKIEPFLDFLIWIAETADEPKTGHFFYFTKTLYGSVHFYGSCIIK